MEIEKLTCPQCGATLPFDESINIICQYCGTHYLRKIPKGGSEETSSQLISGIKFSPFVCWDSQGTQLEAFRLLIPSGWRFEGGIIWLSDNPGMPATMGFRISNPMGVEGFEAFPTLPFYWSNHPLILMTNPPGSKYFGNEVRQPVRSAEEALLQITLPRFRNIEGLQVLQLIRIPEIADAYRSLTSNLAPSSANLDAAKARVRYLFNRQIPVEEDITCVLETSPIESPMLGLTNFLFWNVTFQMAIRATVGNLDSQQDLYRVILGSFKLNPAWYSSVTQISQYLIQNQIRHIQNIGQLSRSLSQNADDVREMNTQSYERQQEMMERVSLQFSQTLREVDTYIDPYSQRMVELPTGYAQAWSNPLGEFIVSSDPNFNPNQDSNQSWSNMEKKEK